MNMFELKLVLANLWLCPCPHPWVHYILHQKQARKCDSGGPLVSFDPNSTLEFRSINFPSLSNVHITEALGSTSQSLKLSPRNKI